MNNLFPILNTNRLILDEVQAKDAQDVFELLSDEEVVKFYDLDAFTHLNQAHEIIAEDLKKYQNGSHLRWAIRDKVTYEFMGSIGIKYINAKIFP